MKKPGVIAIIIVVAFLAASFTKDMVIKIAVEKGVEAVTGLRLNMRSFKAGIINTMVDIKGLRLFNPPAYRDRIMVHMPEIYVDYDLPAIIGGKLHLPEVRINVREFMVVKNERGELNLNALKVVKAQKKEEAPAREAKMPPLQIDSLRLKIGKVIYKDYTKGGPPSVSEFGINLDEEYSDITNPGSLVNLIVVKALTNTTISRLANFDLQPLQGTITDTLQTAHKVAAKAGETVKHVRGLAQKTTEAAKETQAVAKETVEAVKNIFESPFGK